MAAAIEMRRPELGFFNVPTILQLCLILLLVFADAATSAYDRNIELFEGSPCDTDDGNEKGECVLLPQCRVILQQVMRHQRSASDGNRCGFKGNVEIVCCPLDEIDRRPGRQDRTDNAASTRRVMPNVATSTAKPTTTTTSRTSGPTAVVTASATLPEEIPSYADGLLDLRPADVACIRYETWGTGESSGRVFPHITNGERAAFGEFPYVVALGYERDDGDSSQQLRYICGGTLITSRHILTAAHCVSNVENLVPVEVKLGVVNLKNSSEVEQNIRVARVVAHPSYRRSMNYNDIAVLELERSANVSKTVLPICLQSKPISNLGTLAKSDVLVAGWGATSFDSEGTDELQKTPSLSIVENDECRKSYEGFSKLPRGLDDSMICVLDRNVTRSSDACQGDSGGPLLLKGSGTNSVIGVTSFGQSCGSRVPAVYTSVYYYLDWIESVVWPGKKVA